MTTKFQAPSAASPISKESVEIVNKISTSPRSNLKTKFTKPKRITDDGDDYDSNDENNNDIDCKSDENTSNRRPISLRKIESKSIQRISFQFPENVVDMDDDEGSKADRKSTSFATDNTPTTPSSRSRNSSSNRNSESKCTVEDTLSRCTTPKILKPSSSLTVRTSESKAVDDERVLATTPKSLKPNIVRYPEEEKTCILQ